MAIQHRRGVYNNFDPTRMLPGEWAIMLSGDPSARDGMACYMCFQAGKVKRMATFEDMVANIASADAEIVAQLTAQTRQVEAAIQAAEALRVTAEQGRVSAESARVSAERSRANAETARASAESGRSTAETNRATAESQRIARFAEMEQLAQGWLIHHCTASEYDATTRKPTIANPDTGTLYCVPNTDQTADDEWVEWRYDAESDDFEPVGITEANISPITTATIDSVVADGSPVGNDVLKTTGLSYFWSKIKAWATGAFAALSHNHAASAITSGTLGVARGGTGVTTAAAERNRLGLGSTTDAVPTGSGGTGQNSLAKARGSLGCFPQASCTTGSSEATKAVIIDGFTPFSGARLAVRFTNANTVSGAIYLNPASTGPKQVYVDGVATSAANALLWDAGDTLEFYYDGSYWHYLGKANRQKALQSDLEALGESVSQKASFAAGNGTTLTNVRASAYIDNGSLYVYWQWYITSTESYRLQINLTGKTAAVFHFYSGGLERVINFTTT